MVTYGSDLIAELFQRYGFDRIALNPGASYRGLHDSLVNYGDAHPELIVCTNEKIVVNVAHGYAKVTGEPMAAIVHDVVGLMQGTMGLYTAYIDQVPILVFGGTGPMAVGKRRPHIEWIHTAHLQGDLVRNFVKWDDQPFDAQGVVDGLARAYQVATTEPAGPVYSCYDVTFQEEALDEEVDLHVHRGSGPQFPPDRDQMRDVAAALLAAEQPVIVVGRVGRHRDAVAPLVELAELAAAPVVDQAWRFNLPTTHALHTSRSDAIEDADLVLALDVTDLYGSLTASSGRRTRRWLPRPDASVIELRLDLLEGNGWAPKYQKYQPVERTLLVNTTLALPVLVEEARQLASTTGSADARGDRLRVWEDDHRRRREDAWEQARRDWDAHPISTARLAAEVWEAVRDGPWTHVGSTLAGWVRRLWDFDEWEQFPGRPLGTATQIGTSMGVALAYRDSDRLVVNIQPDGDLLFDPGALWTIARHDLPMLVVMYNNRAYYNDWDHQTQVAHDRGRDPSRAHIGMDLDDPAPDFAALARSFGWEAFGPVEDPTRLGDVLAEAVALATGTRRPVLVDVHTAHR